MNFFLAAAVILSGVLSPASPGVLEAVQERRVANGWGLQHEAGSDAVLVAVDD